MANRLVLDVRGVKVQTLLPPAELLAARLVPDEPAPAGSPVIELRLDGGLIVHAMLNGKSVRKVLKAVAEHGPDGCNVLLQGNLKAGDLPGSWVLDCAGISASPKAVREPKAEAVA